MAKTLPKRSEVAQDVTWDLHSVYPSDAAWETDYQEDLGAIPILERIQGKLGESGALLL
jgi:oligoendopeptidase F